MPRNSASEKRILNCLPSQNTETDWGFATAMQAGAVAAPGALPEAVDLRQDWWKVGDQGESGSCVGWAVADSLLRWHFTKVQRLGEVEQLSVRFQWMAAKEQDELISQPTTFIEREGTSIKAALDVARRYGSVRDAVLPFLRFVLYQGDTKTFYAIAANLKISAYFNLGANQDNWRTWLATNGPIVTRLEVDAT